VSRKPYEVKSLPELSWCADFAQVPYPGKVEPLPEEADGSPFCRVEPDRTLVDFRALMETPPGGCF
jgi:hypothetical protein